MFCPNCGTQNPDTVQTCSKCNFQLKGAGPKFKGTMLMMNQPPLPTPAPGQAAVPPGPPPAGAPPTAPNPAAPNPAQTAQSLGAPLPGAPSKLKGTMVGVAPPGGFPGAMGPSGGGGAASPAGPANPGPAGNSPYASTAQSAGMGGPAKDHAAFSPPNQTGSVNPLGGTVAVEQIPNFAGFNPGGGPPGQPAQGGHPPAGDPFGGQGGQGGQGYGPPPGGGGYGAPPGNYGAPPPQGGFGGPPPQGGYGAPPQGGFGMHGSDLAGQQYGGFTPSPGQGGFAQPGGYGGIAPHQGGFPAPGGADDVNTTRPLILGIVAVFFTCAFGAIPIIFAMQAKKAKEQGQIDLARAKAKTATIAAIVLIALGFIGCALTLVSLLSAMASAA